jgi:hypothetical protein
MAVTTEGGVVRKLREDALVLPKDAVVRADKAKAKPGLKFWPVGDDDNGAGSSPAYSAAFPYPPEIDEATRNTPATLAMILETLDGSVAITDERVGPLRAQIVALQTENARLTAALAELRSKVAEIDFITERLRVENKGPPGAKGERGRDGRDGPQGVRGEKGERGPSGATITGWEIDEAQFVARPILSSGGKGPGLHLLGMFQAYDQAVSLTEDRDLVAAAEEARAETERQTESHWAR